MLEQQEYRTLCVRPLPDGWVERDLFLGFQTFGAEKSYISPTKSEGFVVFQTIDQLDKVLSGKNARSWRVTFKHRENHVGEICRVASAPPQIGPDYLKMDDLRVDSSSQSTSATSVSASTDLRNSGDSAWGGLIQAPPMTNAMSPLLPQALQSPGGVQWSVIHSGLQPVLPVDEPAIGLPVPAPEQPTTSFREGQYMPPQQKEHPNELYPKPCDYHDAQLDCNVGPWNADLDGSNGNSSDVVQYGVQDWGKSYLYEIDSPDYDVSAYGAEMGGTLEHREDASVPASADMWYKRDRYMRKTYHDNAFMGNVLRLAKDSTGSRMLQRKIEEQDRPVFDKIFAEAIHGFPGLMRHPFGNYVAQVLMQFCSSQQMSQILNCAVPHLMDISQKKHGTRSVQRLLSCVKEPDHILEITSVLEDGISDLMNDHHGSHVVVCLLTELSSEYTNFVFEQVRNDILKVALHRHGCVTLQRVLDMAQVHQMQMLAHAVALHVESLVDDPCGNYVVQYILANGGPDANRCITEKLLPSFCRLATRKHSSNVLEKCLATCRVDMRETIVTQLPTEELKDLVLHDFGNFVIQGLLRIAPDPHFRHLVDLVQTVLDDADDGPVKRAFEGLIRRWNGSKAVRRSR